ncbi:hypothetical protein [Novosphingobium sp.]|uniref:hypothetical protein n=1 Tax=Novosphingobium sp. TaxID=1874826 RepID=UPI00286D73CE|nr:hypothetical protein [Novosphingobium sp.]
MTTAGLGTGALKAGLALGALLALQGCVAAAIPVLAGATIAKKRTEGPKDGSRQSDASAPAKEVRKAVFVGEEAPKATLAPTVVTETVAVPTGPAQPRMYTVVDLPASSLPAPAPQPTLVTKGAVADAPQQVAPAPAPAPVPEPASLALAPIEAKIEPAPALAQVPLPAAAPPAELVTAPAPRPAAGARVMMPAAPIPVAARSAGYLGLTSYALSRASSPMADAVLDVIDPNDPLSAPRRAQCGKLQPAVLIDLDPELNVFDPAAAAAQPGLAEALSALRAAGITVMWTSALQVEQAEKVSAALARAGLDPSKTDRLLLLKGPGDRKQARRLSAARNWCVVAMAGDRRGDFDEAFDYLKDPDTQIPADRLFGNGWFLAPAPMP